MNTKIGYAALVAVLAGCPAIAGAQSYTYNVEGTFTDGRTLSGFFTVDTTKVNIAQYSGVVVTVSGIGKLLTVNGSGYSPPAVGTGPYEINGFLSGGDFSTTLKIGFTATHAGYQVQAIDDSALLPEDTYYTNKGTTVYLASGTIVQAVTAVPEPRTWVLMVVGFGAVGWGLRRRGPVNVRIALA